MILHPITEIPIASFNRLSEDAQWLRQFLLDKKIKIEPNSTLNEAIFVGENLETWTRDLSLLPPHLTLKDVLSRILGLSYITRALAKASKNKKFHKLSKLFPHLARANPLMTEAAESHKSRNLVFELEVGCIFQAMGLESESAEPDIRVYDGTNSWYLPCKMIYSPSNVTLGLRIKDAISQYLGFPDVYGLVALGISNRIDHDSFMPLFDKEKDIWGSYTSFEEAKRRIGEVLNDIFERIKLQARTRFLPGKDSTRFRGIMMVVHTICGLNAAATILTGVALVRRTDIFDSHIYGPEEDLVKQFNHCAQTIMYD